jgi:hypothetical protein
MIAACGGESGDLMKKTDIYRQMLGSLLDWDPFLLQESRLPGPRANLELAHAVAEEGDSQLFARYLAFDVERAPTNSPQEFLAVCGTLGQGKLIVESSADAWARLRALASDPRWRIREAVAMALQRMGRADMDILLAAMEEWSGGNMLEQRAAAAALCEPGLLCEEEQIVRVLDILDAITASLLDHEDRRSAPFRVLRKGLGYCWSVAVVAFPAKGKAMMERWFTSEDQDVRWIMRQNLKKKRLARMDPEWVAVWSEKLAWR